MTDISERSFEEATECTPLQDGPDAWSGDATFRGIFLESLRISSAHFHSWSAQICIASFIAKRSTQNCLLPFHSHEILKPPTPVATRRVMRVLALS